MSISPKAAWDQRLTRYLILYAMYDADEKFGDLASANLIGRVARLTIDQKHGTTDPRKLCESGRAEMRRVQDAESAASDAAITAFAEPLYAAAIDLLRTPAPSFAATQAKIQMINDLNVDTCDELAEGEAYAIVQAELQVWLAKVAA